MCLLTTLYFFVYNHSAMIPEWHMAERTHLLFCADISLCGQKFCTEDGSAGSTADGVVG